MGVNYDGLCVITSNVTTWRASCVIIIAIWNDALVFLVGEGTAGSSSIIIGWCCVCVGGGVWIYSTVWLSSTTSGEVSAYMGCRRGEHHLGHPFSVCLIFCFFCGWEYHVSSSVYLGGCTTYKVGWSLSQVRCSLLEVFVVWFWSGYGMSPEC